MAKLLNLVATTEDFEKLNSDGIQYTNEGYSNRIRLREESHANIMENLANNVIISSSAISVADESLATPDSSYSLTSVGENFEQISSCKAIMLNSEKAANLVSRLEEIYVVDIKEQEETIVDNDVSVNEEVTDLPLVSEPDVEQVIVNDESAEISTEEIKEDSEVQLPIENSKFDIAYEQLKKETDEILKAKEGALKAQADVELAEQETKLRIEESDQKVLEKSAEQSEIQARKAAAIARSAEVEKSIIAALSVQKDTLNREKQKYIDEQHTFTLRLQELQEYAEQRTRENEQKIIEFQKTIDQERLDLTQVEDELAKKEAILAALSSPMDFTNDQDNVVSFSGVSDSEESYQRKIA